MDVTKFSASAMDSAEGCLSRYAADLRAGRIGGLSSRAALIGTTCHNAIEQYVRTTVMTSEYSREYETLRIFYMASFMETWNTQKTEGEDYNEGLRLVRKWWERTTFDESFTVLSVETKENFKVKTSIGDIPFNYIFDRFDQISDTEYRVVDYKSLSAPLGPSDLHDKIQARAYGLAAQIKFPHATRIWVGFDMLRWENPIFTAFSRDDNIYTYRRIQGMLEKIIATDPDQIPETLNSNCGWCIRKTDCASIQANVNAGGVHQYGSTQELIDLRAMLYFQAQAAKRAYEEVDPILIARLKEEDVTISSTDNIVAKLKARSTRKIDSAEVMSLVGRDIFNKYFPGEVKMGALDDLLADPTIDAEVRSKVESSIMRDYGDVYLETRENKRKK